MIIVNCKNYDIQTLDDCGHFIAKSIRINISQWMWLISVFTLIAFIHLSSEMFLVYWLGIFVKTLIKPFGTFSMDSISHYINYMAKPYSDKQLSNNNEYVGGIFNDKQLKNWTYLIPMLIPLHVDTFFFSIHP